MAMPLAADLIGALPGPALLIGKSQRIEAANAAAEGLFGAGLLGRHYAVAIRQPSILEAIEAVQGGAASANARYLARRDGRDTTWKAQVKPIGDTFLVTLEDLSATEEVDQMRRDFVANVSHELKTPLTAMIGFIETLQGPARDDAAARARFLATMQREAQRMHRLVEDLLSLSRVEATERMRPRDTADVALTLASVLTMLAGKAEEAGVTVQFARPDKPVLINADPDQLRQVFSNLVENAMKYGAQRVELHLAESEHIPELRRPGVVVDVIDDGPGIDSMHLPRLTERFYRVDTHRSREVGGTGLGLAIVKHVVSRHRGRLRVASSEGEGSVFTVCLPREP
ncbi:sensor histidine kinase [Palleronia sp.]|uniref:sensor histidine kinase n=1 Tax=Palleronia sp. TaxID=1940284 RepID=UPI0035C7A634